MRSLWRTLRELFTVLPRGAGRYYTAYSIATSLLAILDTVALSLIVLVVTPLASGNPVTLPVIGELPDQATMWVIVIICLLFISKGIFAVILHWFATRRFAKYELVVGDMLFQGYTRASWEKRSQMSTAEVTRIVDSSMANTNIGFILPLSQVPGNALTFSSVLAVLVIAQPLTALIAFVYLSLFSIMMLFVVSRRSQVAGRKNREYAYKVATIMTEMVDALKEVVLRNKLDEVGRVVTKNREVATRARANISFLGTVPKYAFESALIGGFLIVGGSAYLQGGFAQATVAISLFAATGFRMIPAMNAVQASFTSASANEVYARDVIREVSELKQASVVDVTYEDSQELSDEPKLLTLENVSFSYPGSEFNALKNVSITVPFGSRLAIVGPSGAGKSTLIDILLGLSIPTSGQMQIDGIDLAHVMNAWRQRVGYVPQRVALFDATVAQNVALTWEHNYDEKRVIDVLQQAHIGELAERGEGIHSLIGERGSTISGGQQQRLGIARALYSNPLVIVLDEATSALDTSTENKVTESMRALAGQVTFITVAHRLATIRDYDQICYLEHGEVHGIGSFDDVVEQVPAFKQQAMLAGLV